MKPEPSEPAASKTQRFWLLGITIALLAWGGFLAVGSFLGGANLQDSFRRGLVVFGCTAAFVAFWWTMLWLRRPDNEADEETH